MTTDIAKKDDLSALPPAFLEDLAIGMLTFVECCALHSIDPEQWNDDPDLIREVAKREQELRKNGQLIEHRANFTAELALDKLREKVQHGNMPTVELTKTLEIISKLSTAVRKKDVAVAQATGMRLVIKFPDGETSFRGRTIEQEDTPEEDDGGTVALPEPEEAAVVSPELAPKKKVAIALDDEFDDIETILREMQA